MQQRVFRFLRRGFRGLPETMPIGLLFFAVFYSVYAFTNYINGFYSWRIPLYFDAELTIPFVPQMAFVYMSMNALLACLLFVFPSRQQLMPLFRALCYQVLIAGLIFLLVPIEDGFSRQVPGGWSGAVLAFADAVNLDYNHLPSLHVSLALTSAMAISLKIGRGGLIFLAWAIAIAGSTLLIHEHHVADVIAGGILAWVTIRYFYMERAGDVASSISL